MDHNKIKDLQYLISKNRFSEFEILISVESRFTWNTYSLLFLEAIKFDTIKIMKLILEKWNGQYSEFNYKLSFVDRYSDKYYYELILTCLELNATKKMLCYVLNDFKKRFHKDIKLFFNKYPIDHNKYDLYIPKNINVEYVTYNLSCCINYIDFKTLEFYIQKYFKKLEFDKLIESSKQINIDEHFNRIDLLYKYYNLHVIFNKNNCFHLNIINDLYVINAMMNVIELFGSDEKIILRLFKHINKIDIEITFLGKLTDIIKKFCNISTYPLFKILFEKVNTASVTTYYYVLINVLHSKSNKHTIKKKFKFIIDNYFDIREDLKSEISKYFKINGIWSDDVLENIIKILINSVK